MNTPLQKRFKKPEQEQGKIAPLKGALKSSPKELRSQLGLTQSDFWSPVGVSQSGGSRYESGRKLPAAISTLLHLVHIEKLDLSLLKGDDHRVGQRLREIDPVVYAAVLKKAT